jgi:hypothetical protein
MTHSCELPMCPDRTHESPPIIVSSRPSRFAGRFVAHLAMHYA